MSAEYDEHSPIIINNNDGDVELVEENRTGTEQTYLYHYGSTTCWSSSLLLSSSSSSSSRTVDSAEEWSMTSSERLSSISSARPSSSPAAAAAVELVSNAFLHLIQAGRGRSNSNDDVLPLKNKVMDDEPEVVVQKMGGMNRFKSTSIVINYLSVGYILLPYAFAQGGTLLSCIVLACITLMTHVTVTFILEACARAEALHQIKHTTSTMSTSTSSQSPSRLPNGHVMAIHNRTYELSELSRCFLGRVPRIFFTMTTALDLYGITWAFASIFGQTMADHLPLTTTTTTTTTTGTAGGENNSDVDYQYYLLLFAGITIPLACVPIMDQVWIQLLFLAGRTTMLVLMIATTTVGYFSDTPQFGFGDHHHQQQQDDIIVGPVGDVPWVDFQNIMLLIQICIFSTSFQFAVPGMSSVTRDKSRQTLVGMFRNAVGYIFVTNVILSLLLSNYFGRTHMHETANLNWLHYHGGTCGSSSVVVADGMTETENPCVPAPWANLISKYVVLFAGMDGLDVFPLTVVSLGDILLSGCFGERAQEKRQDWRWRIAFRLLASVPQIMGAMYVKDLGVIAKYAGIFTLLSYTTCPALLALKSRQRMVEEHLPLKTIYHSPLGFSSPQWAWGLYMASGLLIVAVLLDSIR